MSQRVIPERDAANNEDAASLGELSSSGVRLKSR
jgi:hypothetical protein